MNLKNIMIYITLDERKTKFIPYSNSEKFFMLDYEIMNKAVALGSKYTLKRNNNIGKFYDESYIYYYKLLSNENFGIIDVYKIEEKMEVINERNII